MKAAIPFLCLFLSISSALGASQPAPSPPSANPHPPVTEIDKRRVAFGNLAIEKLLMTPLGEKSTNLQLGTDQSIKLDLDEACIKNPNCIAQKTEALNYIDSFKSAQGPVIEYRFTHVIPWSFQKFENNRKSVPMAGEAPVEKKDTETDSKKAAMPVPIVSGDEYMLHSYVMLNNGVWYHLDIILTEDRDGNLKLRRFFIIPIPSNPDDLPPGVEC